MHPHTSASLPPPCLRRLFLEDFLEDFMLWKVQLLKHQRACAGQGRRLTLSADRQVHRDLE